MLALDVSLDDCANAPTKDDVFKKVSKKMASSTGNIRNKWK